MKLNLSSDHSGDQHQRRIAPFAAPQEMQIAIWRGVQGEKAWKGAPMLEIGTAAFLEFLA
ncbi:MAG: hypothetical protein ABI790_12190 [Betaproteobacteria bacterium]